MAELDGEAVPGLDAVAALAEASLAGYDPRWGGTRQSQKFPTPARWRFPALSLCCRSRYRCGLDF